MTWVADISIFVSVEVLLVRVVVVRAVVLVCAVAVSVPVIELVFRAWVAGIADQVTVTILRKLGCSVTVAENGRAAVQMAADSPYDMIFMDCQMPGMDGFEATAEIRSHEAGANHRTRIVAMTAYSLQGDRDQCINAGMDDYLAKPATVKDFQAVLERQLSPVVE